MSILSVDGNRAMGVRWAPRVKFLRRLQRWIRDDVNNGNQVLVICVIVKGV